MYSKIKNIVDSPSYSKVIIYLIVLNGITMGLETSKTFMQSYGAFTTLFNQIVITIFTRDYFKNLCSQSIFFQRSLESV